MLTGKSQLPDLLFAAKSFLVQLATPANLTVHGDASLTKEDSRLICRHLPNARVLMKSERDPYVEERLAELHLSECASFRRSLVLAAKIFDVYFYSSADRVILLDTDTLSFGSLDELRDFASRTEPVNVFGRDPNETPYVHFDFGFRLVPGINTGIAVVTRDTFDLATVEAWLQGTFPLKHGWAEQTILAALATRRGCAFLSADYDVGGLRHDEGVRFSHYCGHKLSAARISMRRDGQSIVARHLSLLSRDCLA
jgi:hypothetical protein